MNNKKGKVNSYIKNPAEVLAENNINIAKAQADANSNPLNVGLDILGQSFMSAGSSMGSGSAGSIMQGLNAMFAMGGKVGPGDGKKLTQEELEWLATQKRGNESADYIRSSYKTITGFEPVLNRLDTNQMDQLKGYMKNTGFLTDFMQAITPNTDFFNPKPKNSKLATGGKVGGEQIEAEGDEIVQTPDGEMTELKGPSHAQGGIDMLVPPGTEIFSARLTGSDGKTMAERKKAREKQANKYQKLFDKNPSDVLLKKSLEKTLANNEKQEAQDMQKMQMAQMAYQMGAMMMYGGTVGKNKYDTGGIVDPFPELTGEELVDKSNRFLADNKIDTAGVPAGEASGATNWMNNLFSGEGGATFGDGVGILGNLVSTFGNAQNTKNARATDTPNINAYENFGQDALEANNQAKQYVEGQRDNNLEDIDLSKASAIRRGRNSARGVNTARALDLATEQNANNQKSQVYNQFAQMMQQILGQEAGLENQQDRFVMQGEQQRDRADRQDKDNYYSNKAQDIATMGTGIQKTGKDINAIQNRKVIQNMLNEMFANFSIDSSGKINNK